MDLIYSKIKPKKNNFLVEDENYFKPLEKEKDTDIKPLPNPYLDELKAKYKPEELTDDGLLTIETQLREIEEADKKLKEYNYNKEMINRVKCVSLHKMGKSIMTNTYNMSQKEKDKLQLIMHTYNDISHEDIIKEFNEIANSQIFDNPSIDYSNLPIYNV